MAEPQIQQQFREMSLSNRSSFQFQPQASDFAFASNALFLIAFDSFGNVAQIALDCLLANCAHQGRLVHVGAIESSYLAAFSGKEAYSPDFQFTCQPMDVFMIKGDTPIYAIIQRSFCDTLKEREFVRNLVDFLNAQHPAEILVLASPNIRDMDFRAKLREFSYLPEGSRLDLLAAHVPLLLQHLQSLPPLASHLQQVLIDREDVFSNEELLHLFDEASKAPYGMSLAKHFMLASDPLYSSGAIRFYSEEKYFYDEEEPGELEPVIPRLEAQVVVWGKFIGSGNYFVDGREMAARLGQSIGLFSAPPRFQELKVPRSWIEMGL